MKSKDKFVNEQHQLIQEIKEKRGLSKEEKNLLLDKVLENINEKSQSILLDLINDTITSINLSQKVEKS
jgi:hypothetical protein